MSRENYGPVKELALSHALSISEELVDTAFDLISSLYDQKKRASDVKGLRYKLNVNKGLESLKLPPVKDSVILHVYRANYQCYLWKNSQRLFLSLPSHVENDWRKTGASIDVKPTSI